jgi:uncharacterized surface protein with fasciclin (FAS1) repeats
MTIVSRWLLAGLLLMPCMSAFAQKDPDVGNITMDPKKTLTQDVEASPIHKRFADALNSSGVGATLNSGGPYTVFAPTDDAFNKLHPSTAPDGEQLKYHVVNGKLNARKLGKMVKKGKGSASLQTLDGGTLKLERRGTILTLTDAAGNTAYITTADVKEKSGYFHVIDAVLTPR